MGVYTSLLPYTNNYDISRDDNVVVGKNTVCFVENFRRMRFQIIQYVYLYLDPHTKRRKWQVIENIP